MASEGAARKGPNDDESIEKRGQLLLFPDRRAFGPLSWRTVRIASMAILLMILSGALIQLFLGHSLRPVRPTSSAKVPS